MSATVARRVERLRAMYAEQIRWIDSHGKTRAGYIARYGQADDPARLGDGGHAIWDADMSALAAIGAAIRAMGGTV